LILLNAATITRKVCGYAAGLQDQAGDGKGWQRWQRAYMVPGARRRSRQASADLGLDG
jgi:hypothetical protein